MRISVCAAALCIIAASPAFGQSRAQQDRLDRVAQVVVTVPVCQRLGMIVDPDIGPKVEAALQSETEAWPLDQSTVARLKGDALVRQGNVLRVDLDAAAGNARTEEQLRGLYTILLRYGRTCMEATGDPIFSRVIAAPLGFDLNRAVTIMADAILERSGLASWQTPAIQERGDMMMIAGACRAHIGPTRSEALVSEFGQTDDARVRDYYRRSFDDGLTDRELNFTLAQCNRVITNQRARISATDR